MAKRIFEIKSVMQVDSNGALTTAKGYSVRHIYVDSVLDIYREMMDALGLDTDDVVESAGTMAANGTRVYTLGHRDRKHAVIVVLFDKGEVRP